MKQIPYLLVIAICICNFITSIDILDTPNPSTITVPKKKVFIPFKLQLSLDVIDIEIEHYQEAFKKAWNTDMHVQVILEEAELLVQTAPRQLQNLLKQAIIASFKKNNINVSFTQENKIVPALILPVSYIDNHTDLPADDIAMTTQKITEEKKLKLPKKHKKKKIVAKQIVAPKKIHGARRTMKRLAKEAEEARKRAIETIKAQITAKKEALLRARKEAVLKDEQQARERIIKEHEFLSTLFNLPEQPI